MKLVITWENGDKQTIEVGDDRKIITTIVENLKNTSGSYTVFCNENNETHRFFNMKYARELYLKE